MKFEYIPFVSDVEANRDALHLGLTILKPDWVGAIPRGIDILEEIRDALPKDVEGAYVSSADLFPDGSANVFVKYSADRRSPAIGFIRVRNDGGVNNG